MKKELLEFQLIEGIKQRDNDCFTYVYRSALPVMLDYVKKTGGTYDDASDLVQDSLMIAFENLVAGLFEGRSGIITYICSIGKNRWNTFLSRQKSKTIPLEKYTGLTGLVDEDPREEELTERARYLEGLLSTSSDRCKEILVAYYYQNCTMEQIAGKLGYTNADNAKSQKAKCLDKLRKAAVNIISHEF